LIGLWQSVASQTKRLLGADFPLTAQQAVDITGFFDQIKEHDPDSQSFRYPCNASGDRTLSSLTHVNVRVLHDVVHRVDDHLRELLGVVAWCYDERADAERAARSECSDFV
jgi:hypothetical protein